MDIQKVMCNAREIFTLFANILKANKKEGSRLLTMGMLTMTLIIYVMILPICVCYGMGPSHMPAQLTLLNKTLKCTRNS